MPSGIAPGLSYCRADSRLGISRRRRAGVRLCVIWFIMVTLRFCNVLAPVLSSVLNSGMESDFRLEDFKDGWEIPVSRNEITRRNAHRMTLRNNFQICPKVPPGLVGKVAGNRSVHRRHELSDVLHGGSFSPRLCRSRYRVAIIVPYRDRPIQLRTLMTHMHPIWQRQQMEYSVYVVTQAGNELFNRAKLMNVGVTEAAKDKEFDCYVFHDTDLLLEDDRCLYWCHGDNPRHLARYVQKFSYQPLSYTLKCMPGVNPFKSIEGFGGVSMLTKKQFEDVNGYSNLYWGWGGEDDDMFLRLWSKGYSVVNPYDEKCSFEMLEHEHESTNSRNDGRWALLYHSIARADQEGLNTLRYKLLSIERRPLYTNITVDVGKPSKRMIDFMHGRLSWFAGCGARMPWNT